jgi:hypothetical protein
MVNGKWKNLSLRLWAHGSGPIDAITERDWDELVTTNQKSATQAGSGSGRADVAFALKK